MTLAETDVLEPLPLTQKHTVVLVDDEPPVLASLQRVLRCEPYEVRATTDPRKALDWVGRGEVSLVVVDQRMPGMCGTDLAEEVRRLSPRTVRLMLTAFPGNALVQHGLAEEIQWLVSKPWNDDALRLAIRRLLWEYESTPPPPGIPSAEAGNSKISGCVEERGVRAVWRWGCRTLGRAARTIAKGVGWILGFLWVADAGGVSRS